MLGSSEEEVRNRDERSSPFDFSPQPSSLSLSLSSSSSSVFQQPSSSTTQPTLLSPHHYQPLPPVIHPRQLLVTCAELISRSEFSSAYRLHSLLSTNFALQFGDSTERLLYYFCKALTERLNRHYSSITTTTNTTCFISPTINPPPNTQIGIVPTNPIITTPTSRVAIEVTSRHSSYLSLNQVTPFIRFTHLTANQAILEAVEGYSSIHILDMDIMHGVQWPPLLQAIVERSATLGRPSPLIRITGAAHDPSLLHRTGDRLRRFAETLGLEFQFQDLILVDAEVVDHSEAVIHALLDHRVRFDNPMEEALAINCGAYLYRLLREYDTRCLRRFLHRVKTLNPRVLTLGEREADHNHPLFLRRFVEALDNYGSIFDSLEATLPPQSRERVTVEEGWFGEEIKDVVGEQGERRKERHQRFESWELVLRSSGFKSLALSPFSLSQAKLLLRLHYPSEGYQLQVLNTNCLLLGWKNRPLYSVSSWQ